MTDQHTINPELLQPEDVPVKAKRARTANKTKTVEVEQDSTESVSYQPKLDYVNPVQNMAVDVFKIYQEYYKAQHQALIEYWTKAIRNAYNPWQK